MAVWPWQVRKAHAAALAGTYTLPSSAPVDPSSGERVQAWQTRAWRLWQCVGELHSPTSYIARVISRRIAWRLTTPAGTVLDEQQAEAILQTAFGDASVEEVVRLLALNLQVAGEAWVLETTGDTNPESTGRGWEVLSVAADKLGDRIKETRAAGRLVLRVYDPDPANLPLADCSVRTVLDPAEDLLILSALSRAQSLSRIAQAGILLVPSNAQYEGDPFGAGLEQAMTAAIQDVSSPAAMVPIKIEMPAELIERDVVKHLTFDRPFDEKVPAKVEAATRRIALGLDMPPEMLTGVADMNHWSAWLSQEETYRGTTAPLAEKIAAVLEQISTYTGEPHTVEPDPTELLARRSTVRDAIDGAVIGAVSLAYVRDAMGATDEDAATEEDLRIIAAARGVNVSRASVADRPAEPGAET